MEALHLLCRTGPCDLIAHCGVEHLSKVGWVRHPAAAGAKLWHSPVQAEVQTVVSSGNNCALRKSRSVRLPKLSVSKESAGMKLTNCSSVLLVNPHDCTAQT